MKIIVLDLDGTLLRTDKTVSGRNLKALKRCREAGWKITIATARSLRSVLELLPEELHNVTMICYNGAEIYENGEKVYENLIPGNHLEGIINWLESHWPEGTVSIETNNLLYSNRKLDEPWTHQVVTLKDIIGQPAAKVLVHGLNQGKTDELNGFIPEACRMVLTDRGTLGHISSSSVSKLAAVRVLVEKMGMSLKDVIAFGDDMNDIEIIREVGTGVAMENAVDPLKEVANRVTVSNDRDGVAAVLETELEKETPAK